MDILISISLCHVIIVIINNVTSYHYITLFLFNYFIIDMILCLI